MFKKTTSKTLKRHARILQDIVWQSAGDIMAAKMHQTKLCKVQSELLG